MYRIAADVGGTHTDSLILTPSGDIIECKAPTTPDDLSDGIIDSVARGAKRLGMSLDQFLGQVSSLILATTATTNTVLQGNGAKTGLLTTQGFRDTLELRRGRRETRFNFKVDFPTMLAPRYLRMEVEERILYDGTVLIPLNEDSVRRTAETLKQHGVEAVAITFLFSFLNPAHERRAAEIVKEIMPQTFVSLSSQIVPILGEFERFSTTAVDAYVGPSLAHHLSSLHLKLQELGFRGQLFVGQSNGGLMANEDAKNKPSWTLASGPCAGPIAGLYLAKSLGTSDVISVDMGGTSFDVSLVKDGNIPISTDRWINWQRVALPMVDALSIGAGGGSIAWIDGAGLLRVGPKSAGAKPGPACYGRGGQEPTVTDADLVLGYLNPLNFLGGESELQPDLAEKAISRIAKPLGLNTVEAAASITRILVPSMTNVIREAAVKQGLDPRDFVLVVGGGGGPVHAAAIAQELGVKQLVVPRLAASLCAFGWLRSDMRFEAVRSKVIYIESETTGEDLAAINSLYKDMEAEVLNLLKDNTASITLQRTVDMRYNGQFREIEVNAPPGNLTTSHMSSIIRDFNAKHEKLYGFCQPDRPVELINFRAKAMVDTPKPELRKHPYHGASPEEAHIGTRGCYYDGLFQQFHVYDGAKLRTGNTLKGPSVVELPATTIVVPPGFLCHVDDFDNFILTQL